MDPMVALQFLEVVSSQASLSWNQHLQVREAIQSLALALAPKQSVEEDSK